ncbi:MAG: hypothetical protein WC497_00020 [Patescibacteria group bacterium]
MNTLSEKLFTEYLNQQNVDWEYEKKFNDIPQLIDFYIHVGKTDIFAEVKEFDQDLLFKEAIKNPGKAVGGSIDQYKPIREKIIQARIKFQRYKNFPCVLVLYNKYFTDLSNITIAGAMYGDIAYDFSIPIDQQKEPTLGSIFFHERGKMRRVKSGNEMIYNTTISAIAVLENKWPENIIRLRVIHNYYARKPIYDDDIFIGEYDEHYRSNKDGNLLLYKR